MEIYPPVDSSLIGSKIIITNAIACRSGWIRLGDVLTISYVNRAGNKINFKERRKQNWKCRNNTLLKHFRIFNEHVEFIPSVQFVLDSLDKLEQQYVRY